MTLFIILVPIFGFILIYFSQNLDKSSIITPKAEIQIVDTNNTTIYNNFGRYVNYEDISSPLIEAFVALEDKRFFRHNGIDYYRTAGAVVHNLQAGKIKEGGSTITQQLAKNTQLTGERTVKRKIKELRLAREIEKNYSKEQILEMYLNAIYFGNGIYGIDSACRHYFGKAPAEIEVPEAAYIAGIVKNPSKYAPSEGNSFAKERQKLVLSLLLEQKYISESAYTDALAYTYVSPERNHSTEPYLQNVLKEASELLHLSEKSLICSPYRIETYFSEPKQKVLHRAFSSRKFESRNDYGSIADYSALLADNQTGGIEAFYGNFTQNILSLRRSPASTVKPSLVYAPAFENGSVTQSTLLLDEKIDVNGYSPRNYGDVFHGYVTVKEALAQSVNTVAVKLLLENGIDFSKKIASSCGLTFDGSDIYPSLALGGMKYGVTQPEITASYMTFAMQGRHKSLSFIKKITDSVGHVLYEHKETPKQVLSETTSYLITDILHYTTQEGTAKKMKDLPFEIAAKTGTGDSDAWNLSYSTKNTLCVWYGDLKNTEKSAIDTSGSGYPTLLSSYLWKSFPPEEPSFKQPFSVTKAEIDTFALKNDQKNYLTHRFTPQKYRESFSYALSRCPSEVSPYFSLDKIEWSIERSGTALLFSVHAPQDYRYRLIEQDITKHTTSCFDMENNFSLQKTTRSFCLYKLSVFYENEWIGYTDDKFLFT